MTPEAGDMLVAQIVPRLRSAIPKCVNAVGAEDPDELVQDAIAVAAQMLHRVERSGKSVTPGNIAYYTILHMKAGRRSHGYSRADVMACGTQLDHKSSLLSFEEVVGYDELDEPVTLGELLASKHDDPANAAARDLDWDQFLSSHDYRYSALVKGMTEGKTVKETPPDGGEGYSRIYALRKKLAEDLHEYLGEEAIADAVRQPRWRGNLSVQSERAACQADRRR